MRQIKFRYRIKVNGEIKYFLYTLEQLEVRDSVIWNKTVVDVLSRDLWTGLTDKNGKEIYEGDIVESDVEYEVDRTKRIVEKVFFNDGMFMIGKNFPLIAAMDGNPEVIGNIYENKELLS